MDWAPEQESALRSVDQWLRDPTSQLYRLFGYAGTGKTTLARHLAEGVEGGVLFAAYTGKAAHVLRSKGCEGASTIHSLIYTPKEPGKAQLKRLERDIMALISELRADYGPDYDVDSNRRVKDLRHLLKEEREAGKRPGFNLNLESAVRDAALVVIDECSMVDEQMGQDLLKFGTKVLVLGDPAQLPPVAGGGFFTDVNSPDFMLTDIHRQARDNPILEMATRVRNGESLSLGSYGQSAVLTRQQINSTHALDANQILVGRNKTRQSSNARVRELLGHAEHGPMPRPGEKLVCLRNNPELGLLNGAQWTCLESRVPEGDRVILKVQDDEGARLGVEAHTHYFLGRGKELPWYERRDAEEFDYGYALTVHKAQGSQWDNVLLFDEGHAFGEDAWRWLYTGITRAAERLVVVR